MEKNARSRQCRPFLGAFPFLGLVFIAAVACLPAPLPAQDAETPDDQYVQRTLDNVLKETVDTMGQLSAIGESFQGSISFGTYLIGKWEMALAIRRHVLTELKACQDRIETVEPAELPLLEAKIVSLRRLNIAIVESLDKDVHKVMKEISGDLFLQLEKRALRKMREKERVGEDKP